MLDIIHTSEYDREYDRKLIVCKSQLEKRHVVTMAYLKEYYWYFLLHFTPFG